MAPDIIIYGIIAAGLVVWLRNILGTRHGDERQRPSSLVEQKDEQKADAAVLDFASDHYAPSQEDHIAELVDHEEGVIAVAGAAKQGLLDILKADRNFDIHFFLQGAQDAFVMIVEAFADGDREALKDLLEPSVYDAFEAAIVAREANDETQETEIHAIKKAEVIEAKIENKMALITVKFIADETGVTRDKDGEIMNGHPDKTTQMQDIWVFGREAKSRDPRWFLFETRGDFDGDNETVPNSD